MKTKPFALSCIVALLPPGAASGGGGQWTVVAWNNLGMHCMDDDYSVFSILPPLSMIGTARHPYANAVSARFIRIEATRQTPNP